MTTQVQVRGAIASTQNARTLTSRELDVDTTNKRLSVHDGSTAGGIPHANVFDIQNNPWTTASTSGTNTYALALFVPLLAYALFQRFAIKIGITNTGASTLNIDTLGAITIKKMNSSGALVDVAAGDLVAGNIYDIVFDGTYFQLMASGGGGSQLIDEKFFTSSGTWTKPTGCNSVEVEVIGAGKDGPAGASCGGSGGGGYAYKRLTSGIGTTESVTVGSNGGTSSFGAHCSASGGSVGGSLNGGAGGNGSGGDLNIPGGDGGSTNGGAGGHSPKGYGNGGGSTSSGGKNASGYGGGGSGCVGSLSGGTSTPGLVRVRSYS